MKLSPIDILNEYRDAHCVGGPHTSAIRAINEEANRFTITDDIRAARGSGIIWAAYSARVTFVERVPFVPSSV